MGHVASLNSRDAIGRLRKSHNQLLSGLSDNSLAPAYVWPADNMLLIEGANSAPILQCQNEQKTRKARIDKLRLGDFPLLQIRQSPCSWEYNSLVDLNLRHALFLQN